LRIPDHEVRHVRQEEKFSHREHEITKKCHSL
jgi:hypothetical protein